MNRQIPRKFISAGNIIYNMHIFGCHIKRFISKSTDFDAFYRLCKQITDFYNKNKHVFSFLKTINDKFSKKWD